MVFPFAMEVALTRPHEPVPVTAFERPQGTHAMHLPAPGRILKLSGQSNNRRTAVQARLHRPGLLPCNFAVVAKDFPRLSRPPKPPYTSQLAIRAPRQKGTARNFAAPAQLVIVTKLSHRIGLGNPAYYYCICYTCARASFELSQYNFASKTRDSG
jgi:hypothetical protein